MNQIPLICHHCGQIHTMNRTPEIPEDAQTIHCNFCMDCEDAMDDYYNEWFSDEPLPDPVDPNQLIMEFEY